MQCLTSEANVVEGATAPTRNPVPSAKFSMSSRLLSADHKRGVTHPTL